MLGFAISLARAWTAVYTRGLAHEVRAERREEIDSDLWDQRYLAQIDRQSEAGTAAEVLARWLLGIPADLAWRIEAGFSNSERRTSVNNSLPMRIGFFVAAAPMLILIANGIGMLAGGGDFPNQTERFLYGFAVTGAAGVALTGLWLSARAPILGLSMVIAGSAVAAGLFYWMLPITIPVAIAVILFALKRSGLDIWPFRTSPTGPTGTA